MLFVFLFCDIIVLKTYVHTITLSCQILRVTVAVAVATADVRHRHLSRSLEVRLNLIVMLSLLVVPSLLLILQQAEFVNCVSNCHCDCLSKVLRHSTAKQSTAQASVTQHGAVPCCHSYCSSVSVTEKHSTNINNESKANRIENGRSSRETSTKTCDKSTHAHIHTVSAEY